jgi:hypothetical protein
MAAERSKARLIVVAIGTILNNMEREELHRLVDGLPEGAFEHAWKVLDHFQTWPPHQPPEIEEMRKLQRERMRQAARPGVGFVGGGGGGYRLGVDGRIRNGHHSFGYPEDGAVVLETHHFHEGVEVTISERMRLGEDGKTLIYDNAIVGPDGKHYTQDITFAVGNADSDHLP